MQEPIIENPLIGAEDQSSNTLRKYFTLLVVLSVMALGATYIVPMFIDWDKEKQDIVAGVKAATGRDLVIDGTVEFDAFPRPSFSIKGARLKNAVTGLAPYMIQAETVAVQPALIPLVFGQIRISEILLDNVTIDIENYEGLLPNWNFVENRAPGSDAASAITDRYLGINALVLTNVKMVLHSGDATRPTQRWLPLSRITVAMDSIKGPFRVEGALFSSADRLDAGFVLETEELSNEEPAALNFTLKTGSSTLTFVGQVEHWSTQPYISGEMNASIDQSLENMASYFGIDNSVLPTHISTMLSTQATQVTSTLFMSAKGIEAKNVAINSSSTKGNGTVTVAFGDTNDVDVKLSFAHIGLDGVVESEERREEELEDAGGKGQIVTKQPGQDSSGAGKDKDGIIAPFSVAKNMRLLLDISADKVTYRQHDVRDAHVVAELKNGTTIIRSLVAKQLPGNSNIDLSVTLDKEDPAAIGQRFNSVISASGENLYELLEWIHWQPTSKLAQEKLKQFSLKGSVEYSPERVDMSNLALDVGTISMLGRVVITYDREGVKRPTFNSVFQVKELNLDHIMDTEKQSDTVVSLSHYDSFEDARKFDYIRGLDLYFSVVGSKIMVGDLILAGRHYKDFNMALLTQPGKLTIKEFSTQTEEGKSIRGSLFVDASQLRPKMEFTLDADEIVLGEVPEDMRQKPEFPVEEFSFKRFKVADTKFNLAIKSLIMGRLQFADVSIGGDSGLEALNINKFRGRFEEGNVDIKAVFGIERASASASISLVSADVPTLLRNWFGLTAVTQGKFSASGTLTTTGTTIKGWIENFEGAMTVTARGVDIEGFDLASLSSKLATFGAIDEVRAFTRKILSQGKSNIDYASGNVFLEKGIINLKDINLSSSVVRSGVLNWYISLLGWKSELRADGQLSIRDRHEQYGSKVPISVSVKGTMDKMVPEWSTRGVEGFWERNFY